VALPAAAPGSVPSGAVPNNELANPWSLARAGQSRALRSTASVLANGALLALLGCGVLIAIAAAAGESFLVATPPERFPAWIAGPLGGLGSTMGRPEFLTLVLFMWVAYAIVIVASSRVRPALALSVVVALHVVFLLAPPLLSTDVFSYLDYARLGAVHGLNPYVHTPFAARQDPVFELVGPKWDHTATAYGPLFTLLSYPLAHLSLPNAVWALKGMATLGSLGCVALVWRAAQILGRDPLRPALLVGLNPLLLVYAVAGGHNDLLMMALMVGAVVLAAGSERAAGAAVVAAATVKASAAVVLPFMLAGLARPRRILVGAAVAVAAAALVSGLAFDWQAWRLLSVVRDQQQLVGSQSFRLQVGRLLGFGQPGVTVIAQVALALTAAGLLVAVRRGADWVAASGWMLLAIVVATSFLLPWYTVWALPLAAISADRRLLAATLFIEMLFFVHQLGPLLMA
jgi:alpha-1,6-mannosyltransferase